MKKQQDHAEQLLLDLDNSVRVYRESGDRLAQTIERLGQYIKEGPWEDQQREEVREAKAKIKKVKAVIDEDRKRLSRLVQYHAREKRIHWQEMWKLLYSRYRNATGFDAVAKGLSRGIKPIEAVAKAGRMESLLKFASAL